jgi:linoleoyl-CoA desaturase
MSVANRVAGLSINVIGGNSKRWIEGHVRQHHGAPNVVGKDEDIELAPFARMAPTQSHRPWHTFQHVYIWGVYAFTSAAIIIGDVVGIIQESISGDRHGRKPTLRDHVSLFGSKGLFFAAMLGVPMLLHPWWIVALGAITVVLISGLVLGIVFQLAHVVEEADFSAVEEPVEARWHEWQVRASVDFCQGDGVVARAFTWYCGALNYQTEHHLFPGLPHPAYPAISPIVADTCREFGIRYHVQPTLRAAVRSHAQHLRRLGQPTSDRSSPEVAEAA